jgi:hypothetical protein
MRLVASALVLLVASCASPSEVRIEPADFGVVAPASSSLLPLRLHNAGKSSAKLLQLERRGGSDGFTVTPGQVQMDRGERVEWTVSFSSAVRGLAEARYAAVFDTGTTEFSVRARVADRCAFAETFDVGDARVGSSVTRTFTVVNPLDERSEVYVGSPVAPFSVQPAGTLKLAPHESKEVTVVFAPRTAGEPRVRWLLRPSADCTVTEVTLAARAVDTALSATPGRLDFGPMTTGSSRTREVVLHNHTRAPLTLTSILSSTPAFSAAQLPLVLPGDGQVSVAVEARASSEAPFDGTLEFVTASEKLVLPVLANRSSPECLTASASSLDFGSTEAGCRSHDARVRVLNDCPHEVRLGDRVASPGFTFIAASSQSVLGPGEALEFALTHVAASEGDTTGLLQLTVDVLDGEQVLTLPLVAQTTPAREVEESELIPPFLRPLDVLFVIDDSPAMVPLTASMESNLGAFAQWANANGYDFRVGVMSSDTEPAQLARLRRTSTGAGWIDKPTRAELQALGRPRGLATARSSCLETLVVAFGGPARGDPTELGGLLRPGAGLYVICVTNTRDAVQTPPIVTISALLSSLPRPYELSVVANFVEVPGCTAQLEHGPLTALVAQTNGVREEVCTPNWAAALERIGRNSFGYRTNFHLQQRPALTRGPLRVFIDEVELPMTDPDPRLQTTLWRYDGNVNAVLFEPLYAPEPGKTVSFRYVPDCAR